MFEEDFLALPILLLSVGIWALSIFLSKHANGSFFRPTVSNWFMWWLFIEIILGATYLMIVRDNYEEAVGLYAYPDAIMFAWWMSLAAAILIPLGMNLANHVWMSNPHRLWQRFCVSTENISSCHLSRSFKLAFGILVLVTVLVTAAYYAQVNIPLMGVFNGLDAKELGLMRSQATNDFTGKYYRYNLFKTHMLTMLVLISFFLRHNGNWRYVFWALFFLRVFTCLADIQKRPVVDFLIIFCFAYFYEKKRIPKKLLISLGIFIFTLIITMYVFFMGLNLDANNPLAGILRRMMVAEGVGVPWSMVYVENYGYLWGSSLPNPAGLLPFTHIRYTVELMYMVFPGLIERGVVGTMPTVFYGEIFANFGVPVALFSMLLVGCLLRSLDIYCQHCCQHHALINLAMYIYLIEFFMKYVGTSILGIVLDLDLYIPVLTIILMRFFYHTKKERTHHHAGTLKTPPQVSAK